MKPTDIARIIMKTNEKKRQGIRTLSPLAGARLSRTHKPDDLGLEEWQRLLRKQYGAQQEYRLENLGGHPIFSEFRLHNPETARTYKIAIRGSAPLDNYCSCPDYAATGLGTCKHVEFVLSGLMKRKGAGKAFLAGYTPSYSEVHLRYGLRREAAFRPGKGAPPELLSLAAEYFDGAGILKEDRLSRFNRFLDAIPRDNGHEVRCYDDVLGYIAEHQDAEHRRR